MPLMYRTVEIDRKQAEREGNDTQDKTARLGTRTKVTCNEDCSLNTWGGSATC